MAAAKISNNKTNRISLPDNRSLHSHSHGSASSHELLLKQHQQYPQLITPPEEPLPTTTAVGSDKQHETNGVTTVPRLPTTTTTTTTPNIVSQRPTTPPPLPQRPRARTINIVPGFKEEELAMPPLPSMPVRSVSKGTASAISSMLSSRLHNNGHTTAATPTNTCQYPDMQHFDRLPPHIKTYPTHHRRTLRAIAACQGRLATASYTIKAWDDHRNNKNASITLTPSTDSTGNDRVSSLAYTCTGNYLFAGLDDGCTVVMDTQKAKILAELQHHEYAVKHILRVANTELWTIDEGGQLLRYPMHDYDDSMPETIMYDGYHHRVTPKAISAVVLRATQGQGQHHVLAMTTGDTIDAYRFVPFYSSAMPQIQVQLPYHVVRIPSDLGQITQLVALPQGKLACAHVNGRISVWDANNDTWEQTLQVAVPTYGITAMALSLDRFLWTGYRTGMIYIYDISSDEQWSLVKMWEAHHGPITMFTVDELGLLCDDKKPLMQVVSADQQGNVTVWDGLLAEYQRDQHMKQLEETYCDYRPTRIQISSWNIDALSPESITGQDKALLDEWLSSMRDADIIVVGLQEIVDLESKRQTARSLFIPRKKQNKLDSTSTSSNSSSSSSSNNNNNNSNNYGGMMDAETLAAATPQYSAWRNYITGVLQDKYMLLKTEHLVGLFSLVFIKHEQQMRAKDCHSTVVKTGLKVMNKCWHGNKGATAIRLSLDDSSLCFVNCHLAAGQSRIEQRNADADGIFKTAKFVYNNKSHYDDDVIILDHEHCFVSGDLNYRLDTWTRQDVLDWLKEDNRRSMAYRELQLHDQLYKQRQQNPLLKLALFREAAPIRFDPTYKYDPGTDQYDTSDKQRVPAWCDRILYRSSTTSCEYYRRHEVKASDHRPISAGFEVAVKTVRRGDCEKTAKVVAQAWDSKLALIVQECKARYVADISNSSSSTSLEEARRQLKMKGWNVQRVIDEHSG